MAIKWSEQQQAVFQFVETDTGTERTTRFVQKIREYVRAWRSGNWRAHLTSWPLVLTGSLARSHPRRRAASVPGAGVHDRAVPIQHPAVVRRSRSGQVAASGAEVDRGRQLIIGQGWGAVALGSSKFTVTQMTRFRMSTPIPTRCHLGSTMFS